MAVLHLLLIVLPLQTQTLADRVAAINDGIVTFNYTARPGVCGDGEYFIRTGRHSYHGSLRDRMSTEPCIFGPVQVRLTLNDGVVTRVQSWVGPIRSRGETRDLGAVSAPDAARYLLDVARRASPSAAAKAIMPAVLADSAVVWPTLLAIAKDADTRGKGTRQEAMLWLSRFASGALAGHPNDPLLEDEGSDDPDESLKVHAVFVLSQLPRGEGVPELLQVAKSNQSRRVRSQALFWLGQSGDPRALALFESVLKS